MGIEAAVLISALSLAFAVYQGIVNMRRSSKKDTEKDTVQMATVMVKLEEIDKGVKRIQDDMKNVNIQVQENRERIIKTEESVKQAHKRLDELFKGGC